MNIQVPTVLLDGTVLSLVNEHDLYGYAITKQVQNHLNISESTMYPVMRRLQKNGYLETYDEAFEGRHRRYYRITESGRIHLAEIRAAWGEFRVAVDNLLIEEKSVNGGDEDESRN